MRLPDILGAIFWVSMISLPLTAFIHHKRPWREKSAALLQWSPVPIVLTLSQSCAAFLMSGFTGFIGVLLPTGASSTALTLLFLTTTFDKR